MSPSAQSVLCLKYNTKYKKKKIKFLNPSSRSLPENPNQVVSLYLILLINCAMNSSFRKRLNVCVIS